MHLTSPCTGPSEWVCTAERYIVSLDGAFNRAIHRSVWNWFTRRHVTDISCSFGCFLPFAFPPVPQKGKSRKGVYWQCSVGSPTSRTHAEPARAGARGGGGRLGLMDPPVGGISAFGIILDPNTSGLRGIGGGEGKNFGCFWAY